MPVDVMLGQQPSHQNEVSEYERNLRDTLEVQKHAREQLQAAQKHQKDHYGQQTAKEQIEVGDRVLLRDPVVKKGHSKKL